MIFGKCRTSNGELNWFGFIQKWFASANNPYKEQLGFAITHDTVRKDPCDTIMILRHCGTLWYSTVLYGSVPYGTVAYYEINYCGYGTVRFCSGSTERINSNN